MKKNRYRQAVYAAAWLVILLGLLPLATAAQVEEARAHIDGMV